MNDQRQSWTEADFDSLSWHDNRVHGISFVCPREGYENDLVLDIDFIVEWIKTPEGTFRFAVAPASLVFHNADNVLIETKLAYREILQIDRIQREDVSTPAGRNAGCHPHRYTIFLHSLSGAKNRITLESTSFEQHLRKPPVLQDSPWLESEARNETMEKQ